MGTVDDYLGELEVEDRAAIDRVYALARTEVPEAEQGKGYGMPALVYRGKPLISVMRAKKHIGIYPFSPDAVSAVADEVNRVEESGLDKGTIRFQPSHPLPDEVVLALVRFRREQIDG
ncbi:Uncharacterized conserved protein YdhG, YjbR/CyaY-like superfamily, DUF1801 family [Microbacterium sp. cf046]|uniref:iron chaperone n=1 Tax=Microbacterium sp. cf046 TaxID=1761803 RepID=UPI0008F2E246|nr:DUF1801 domain-containing protein [Microbacterium sp. cf046]SFS15922.1 Uncharacterized conserved protein YdhG, YjbR/CyaY-like superfamily, DUF1801 family [Microbacterium sp. cf046]